MTPVSVAADAEHSCIAPQERARWVERGFLPIRAALASDRASELRRRILDLCGDPVRARAHLDPARLGDGGNSRDVDVVRAVAVMPELVELLDHDSVFPKILGLMGPYVQVQGTEILVRFPHPETLVPLHADGGPSLRNVVLPPQGNALFTKCIWFLDDVTQADRANFCAVPGSHRRPFPVDVDTATRAAIEPVLARAGDALVFPWTLCHAVGPHRGTEPRVAAIVRYMQMWARPADYDTPFDFPLTKFTPRQRRLLGDLGDDAGADNYSYYRCPCPDQLETMFDPHLRSSAEFVRYADQRSYSAALYGK
jgi:hypothetical protein